MPRQGKSSSGFQMQRCERCGRWFSVKYRLPHFRCDECKAKVAENT